MMNNVLTLKLQNFRRFAETAVISFPPGLTIISGPNGAGKSTLVESFLYALFGQKRGRGTLDPRTDNTSGEIRVECELFIDDQLVKIIRSSTSAAVWVNNALQIHSIPSSLSMANRQISAFLGGLTRDQFERTYVALQGDTAGLVEDKPEERRKIIENILQLEVLSKAVQIQGRRCDETKSDLHVQSKLICDELSLPDSTRALMRRFQDARKYEMQVYHLQMFVAALEQALAERRSRADEAKMAVTAAQAEVAAVERRQAEHKAVIDRITGAYEHQEQLLASYQDLGRRIATVEGGLQQVEQDIGRYQENIQKAEHCAHAAEEHAQLQEEIKRYDARLGHIPLIEKCYSALTLAQSTLKQMESQLEPLARVEGELQQAHQQEAEAKSGWDTLRTTDPTSTDYEEWRKQNARLTLEETQNEEALRLLRSSAGDARCPTCHQRFTEHTPQHRIEHLTSWLGEELPRRRAHVEQQKKDLERRKQHWQQDQQSAEEQWHQWRKTVSALEKQVQLKDALCLQREAALAQLRLAQHEWAELHESSTPDPHEKESLQKKREALSKRAGELKESADSYAQLPSFRAYLAEKQREETRLRSDAQQLRGQQATIGYDPGTFQAIKGALSEAQAEAAEIYDALSTARVNHAHAQSSAQKATEAADRAHAAVVRFTEAVREFQQEERLHALLEDFKKHFFAANTEEVTRRTSQLLLHAVTDQSILGIKFDSHDFYYIDASNIPRSIGRLSGGEKALVGLCLRIALAEQAQALTKTGKVKFLILDEVLSSLDDERCDAVQSIFEDVQQRGIFEHIIMITHLDTVKQCWRATGLEVQKVGSKTSTVLSVSPGEVPLHLGEEIEV